MSNQYGQTPQPIKCIKCGKDKARRFFSYNNRNLGATSGYRNICKPCSRAKKEKERRDRDWKYRANEILYMNAKSRAKKSGIPFDIKREDVIIPDVCPVLGIKLFRESKESWRNAPSIDRINNDGGYTKDNIMIMSRRANILKKDATIDELIMIGNFYRDLKEKQN